jgi:hypothetical protein
VAAQGCNTHTQRAAAQAARSRSANCGSRGPWRRLPYPGANRQAVAAAQQRWVAKWSTGGRAEQAYKHRARDVGETANLRSFSGMPSCREVRRPRGFLGTPASRAPSDFFRWRDNGQDSDANAPRERSRLSEIGVGVNARKYIIPDIDEAIAMSCRTVGCSKLQQ